MPSCHLPALPSEQVAKQCALGGRPLGRLSLCLPTEHAGKEGGDCFWAYLTKEGEAQERMDRKEQEEIFQTQPVACASNAAQEHLPDFRVCSLGPFTSVKWTEAHWWGSA